MISTSATKGSTPSIMPSRAPAAVGQEASGHTSAAAYACQGCSGPIEAALAHALDQSKCHQRPCGAHRCTAATFPWIAVSLYFMFCLGEHNAPQPVEECPPPGLKTAPHASSGCLLGLQPLRRTPDRRLSSLEARRGPSSSPQAAAKRRVSPPANRQVPWKMALVAGRFAAPTSAVRCRRASNAAPTPVQDRAHPRSPPIPRRRRPFGAAPQGILFTMLEAAGMKETWLFRKAREPFPPSAPHAPSPRAASRHPFPRATRTVPLHTTGSSRCNPP